MTPEKGREDAGAEFREADKFHVRSVQESTKAEPCLQNCLDTARQIDKIMTCTPLDPAANTHWSAVKTERNALARVIGYC